MIHVDRLQTKGVFAVNCKIYSTCILVGLLCVNKDASPISSLLDQINDKRYKVKIPDWVGYQTNIELPLIV